MKGNKRESAYRDCVDVFGMDNQPSSSRGAVALLPVLQKIGREDSSDDDEPRQKKRSIGTAATDDISITEFCDLLKGNLEEKFNPNMLLNPENYGHYDVFKNLAQFLAVKALPVQKWENMLRPKLPGLPVTVQSHPELWRFVTYLCDEVPLQINASGDPNQRKTWKTQIKRCISHQLLSNAPNVAFFLKKLHENLPSVPKIDSLFGSKYFKDAEETFKKLFPGMWERKLNIGTWLDGTTKAVVPVPVIPTSAIEIIDDDEVSTSLLLRPYNGRLITYKTAAEELKQLESEINSRKERMIFLKEAMKHKEMLDKAKLVNTAASARLRKVIGHTKSDFSNSIMDLSTQHLSNFFEESDFNKATMFLRKLTETWKSVQEHKVHSPSDFILDPISQTNFVDTVSFEEVADDDNPITVGMGNFDFGIVENVADLSSETTANKPTTHE